jgi:hypothetical protein
MYSLILTAQLNDVVPRASTSASQARIADRPASQLRQLLPWR